jgi:alpha-mannosidase
MWPMWTVCEAIRHALCGPWGETVNGRYTRLRPPCAKPSRRRALLSAASAAGAALSLLFTSGKSGAQDTPKRIYLAGDDHTDYFWSADDVTYRRAFVETIDHYLALADQTASLPAIHQSRWNCDGSLWLWEYERSKSAAEFRRLIDRVKSGHISAPLNVLVSCLGGAPAEAVLRGMYYSGHLERRFELRFTLAVAMENQTLPYGLGSLWAGAGARYSWRGICGCATAVADGGDRQHEIYWWTAMDGSRILMKWNSLYVSNESIGGYAEARNPRRVIEFVDGDRSFRSRYPFRVIGAFGQGWDDLQTIVPLSDTERSLVRVAQVATDASRTVIVSNEEDFFRDFESTYGARIPSLSASFGNEWDLYCASLAEVSARIKRATEKLRAAEAMAALVALRNPQILAGRQSARDRAWIDFGLYWEHNWGVDGGNFTPNARAAWQRQVESRITAYVDGLHRDALSMLGGMIQKDGVRPRLFVFNPLGWARTDVAEVVLRGEIPVAVFDLATGLEVRSEVIGGDGGRRLRFLADDVPAVGYKVYELRAQAPASWKDEVFLVGDKMIESADHRVAVDGRGAITSLIDKRAGDREFVRMVNGRAMNDLGPGVGEVSLERLGPVSVTLLATATDPVAHTTRVTLYAGVRRIEIENLITQNFSRILTWGFGVNVDSSELHHEEVGAILRARLTNDDARPGHYSPRQARYDWLTLNHFADISATDGPGVTLSNADCYFMRYGNSSTSRLDTGTPYVGVLAGGRIDSTTAGIRDQGGDSRFLQRFALRTHTGFDPGAAMRFALEHQNPLVVGSIGEGGDYPSASFSLLSGSDPDVLLWALKPSEEGVAGGLIARYWNVRTAERTTTMKLAVAVAGARAATHLETDLSPLPVSENSVSLRFMPQQIRTFRVLLR